MKRRNKIVIENADMIGEFIVSDELFNACRDLILNYAKEHKQGYTQNDGEK